MYKIISIGLTLILSLAFLNSSVLAHAGVQKRNSDFIVTLYQSPISLLVGEKMKTTFVVTDYNFNAQSKVVGRLTLIDTFYGDESRDKKILSKSFVTDANGAFEFEYIFDKENYFNIELVFRGKESKAEHIDFLVQPRKSGTIITRVKILEIIVFIGLGAILGIFGVEWFKRQNSKKEVTSKI